MRICEAVVPSRRRRSNEAGSGVGQRRVTHLAMWTHENIGTPHPSKFSETILGTNYNSFFHETCWAFGGTMSWHQWHQVQMRERDSGPSISWHKKASIRLQEACNHETNIHGIVCAHGRQPRWVLIIFVLLRRLFEYKRQQNKQNLPMCPVFFHQIDGYLLFDANGYCLHAISRHLPVRTGKRCLPQAF